MLYIDFEDDATPPQKAFENLSEVYIAGIICLAAADLIQPTIFFNKNSNRWNRIQDFARK